MTASCHALNQALFLSCRFFRWISSSETAEGVIPSRRAACSGSMIEPPATMALPARDAHWPAWTQNQRNSWHGVEFPYHSRLDVWEYYRRYLETLLGVDDSVGRVVEHLRQRGWLDNTVLGKSNVNNNETIGMRLAGLWSFSDRLTVTGKAVYQDRQSDGSWDVWAKDLSIGNRMINARAETISEKPSFFKCLISFLMSERSLSDSTYFTL